MIPLSVSCAHCIIYNTFLLQTLFHAKDGAPAHLHLLHDFRNGCVGEQSCHDLLSLGLHAGEQFWVFWQKKIENFFLLLFLFLWQTFDKKNIWKLFFLLLFLCQSAGYTVAGYKKKIGNFHSLFWNLIVDVKVSHNSYLNHNRNLDNQDRSRQRDRKTDRQKDRKTERQIDRKTDRQEDR